MKIKLSTKVIFSGRLIKMGNRESRVIGNYQARFGKGVGSERTYSTFIIKNIVQKWINHKILVLIILKDKMKKKFFMEGLLIEGQSP